VTKHEVYQTISLRVPDPIQTSGGNVPAGLAGEKVTDCDAGTLPGVGNVSTQGRTVTIFKKIRSLGQRSQPQPPRQDGIQAQMFVTTGRCGPMKESIVMSDIYVVVMPFGPLRPPPLAVGQTGGRGLVTRDGCGRTVSSVRFGKQIGYTWYEMLADAVTVDTLLSDWFFSKRLLTRGKDLPMRRVFLKKFCHRKQGGNWLRYASWMGAPF